VGGMVERKKNGVRDACWSLPVSDPTFGADEESEGGKVCCKIASWNECVGIVTMLEKGPENMSVENVAQLRNTEQANTGHHLKQKSKKTVTPKSQGSAPNVVS